MAKPIEFRPAPQGTAQAQGSREKIIERLGEAPIQHADALLAAYDLLQQMHDSGTLDLLRGTLSAGDKIVEEISAMLVQPESIRGIRNFLLLSRIMTTISPEVLERIVKVLPLAQQQQAQQQVEQHGAEKPPSLLSLARRLFSADGRRALALGLTAAETLGKATRPQPR